MAGTDTAIVNLSDLVDGQEGEFFAALVKTEPGTDKHGNAFVKCHFRDKHTALVAPFWSSNPLLSFAREWKVGEGYRLRAKAELNPRYGLQLNVLSIQIAGPEDAEDGYDFFELVESSRFTPDSRMEKIREFVARYVQDASLNRLVITILDAHADMLRKMPAAQSNHHASSGGLIEHLWSVSRVSVFLATHYADYYHDLNPPLNRDVIVAAAILHDIGKLREFDYHPVETKYTKHGNLIGHIVLGRDMVRDIARRIDDFPEETLLLLEHAILAHHGRAEFGAPKPPLTIEALIVHYADEIDAKINAVASERIRSNSEDEFTGKIWAADNRRFYKGIPVETPSDDELDSIP